MKNNFFAIKLLFQNKKSEIVSHKKISFSVQKMLIEIKFMESIKKKNVMKTVFLQGRIFHLSRIIYMLKCLKVIEQVSSLYTIASKPVAL